MTIKESHTGSNKPDKKARNTLPPYISLSEAIAVAGQIYEQSGGTADAGTLSRILGNSPSSSSYGRKLQALRIYRLTTGMMPPVTLSEIGLSIVAPRDEAQRLHNLKGAAIGPEVFRTTYERFKGKLLPQDEYLINTFQQDVQVPPSIAQAWLVSFKSALDTACLLHLRPDGKIQVMEGPALPAMHAAPASADAPSTAEEKVSPATQPKTISDWTEGNGHTTRIALSGSRFGVISIPDSLSKKDAARLKGALTGIAAIIDSMIDDPEEED